ncbi:MAG: cyclic nucleotide-binding domain-containing protein [Bacteroidota bacterium]
MVEIFSLYNSISNSEKKLFETKVEVNNFKKGEFLLIDGEIQNKLYLVENGLAMMYFDNGDKIQAIDFAYRNRFCVDVNSFSNQTKSIYCIECMEDCTIESITYDDLINVFENSRDTERAYRILTERILYSVIKRHMNLSCMSIQERFNQIINTRPELFRLVQHKYIASYLNIDPTNFSKLYNQCPKKKIEFN